MTPIILADSFSNSPLGATVIGVALTALVTVAVAVVRMALTMSAMQSTVNAIKEDVDDLKTSPDIMRYSDMREIGRVPSRRQTQGRSKS